MWLVGRPDGSITPLDNALPGWARKQAIQLAGYDWNWKPMQRAGHRAVRCWVSWEKPKK